MAKVKKDRTIIGTLVPLEWDENQRVTAIALSTRRNEQFIIDRNLMQKELLPFVQHPVEVTGKIRVHEEGYTIINVNRYRILETDLKSNRAVVKES